MARKLEETERECLRYSLSWKSREALANKYPFFICLEREEGNMIDENCESDIVQVGVHMD